MNGVLEYKGYHTKVTYVAETNTLRGVIEGISDFVDFETDDLSKVIQEFHSAVDDYLEFCKEVGKNPEKEYKGSFNVRIRPELHRSLAVAAFKADESINRTVEKAIEAYVSEEKNVHHTVMVALPGTNASYSNTSKSSITDLDFPRLIANQQNKTMRGGA